MMYLDPQELLTKRRIEKLVVENGYREDMPEEEWPVTFSGGAGQWHTVRSLESGTVILEMKDGAYEAIGEEDVLKG